MYIKLVCVDSLLYILFIRYCNYIFNICSGNLDGLNHFHELYKYLIYGVTILNCALHVSFKSFVTEVLPVFPPYYLYDHVLYFCLVIEEEFLQVCLGGGFWRGGEGKGGL